MLFFFTYRKGFMLRALPEKAPFEACFPQKPHKLRFVFCKDKLLKEILKIFPLPTVPLP